MAEKQKVHDTTNSSLFNDCHSLKDVSNLLTGLFEQYGEDACLSFYAEPSGKVCELIKFMRDETDEEFNTRVAAEEAIRQQKYAEYLELKALFEPATNTSELLDTIEKSLKDVAEMELSSGDVANE